MAGIDGGVGGQPRIQPGSTTPTQRTDGTEQSQGTNRTGTENLSVSHTDGTPSSGRSNPTAGIPSPSPEAQQYLSTLSTQELQGLLAGLSVEVRQTQDEAAVNEAKAQKAEVKETQEQRKAELEQLNKERSEAENKAKCAKVELAFAKIISFGDSTPLVKKLNAKHDQAMQKVAIIDLQIQGLVETPPPELSPELRAVVDTFSQHAPFENLTNKPKKDTRALIDNLRKENRIDDATYIALNELVNKHSISDRGEANFFKDVVLLQAQLDAGQKASAESIPVIPTPPPGETPSSETTPNSGESTAATGTAQTESTDKTDASWLADFEAMMREQEEEMNKIIADMEESQQDITSAAQDSYDIQSMRHTGI